MTNESTTMTVLITYTLVYRELHPHCKLFDIRALSVPVFAVIFT